MTYTIKHDGDTWRIVSEGKTREDGKTFCHLASTTRGRQQRNGFNPVQINDWVDLRTREGFSDIVSDGGMDPRERA